MRSPLVAAPLPSETEPTCTTIERPPLSARVFELAGRPGRVRYSYAVMTASGEQIGFGSCDTYDKALAAAMRAVGDDSAPRAR